MKASKQISESLPIMILLTLSGGFMDAYSYLCRGEVFANAQTGNILLFGVNLSMGHWSKALQYVCPVLAFAIGIAAAEFVRRREGEAISWHLSKALKLDDKNTSRITFNEITKNAVKKSIKEARDIDMNLVDAQQARRVLDRMVGYQISPVLWAKVKRGLSAGRVQSVALRIIADRETEINNFISKEYWTLSG